ncbi:MAG: hypothetical protein KIT68_09705, partial [Phycisphaeraceae bacterium]|nr:hypothetical protein [Phycisphaeraceae bacterium]
TLSGSGTTLFAAPVGGITPLANLFNNRTGAISIGGNQSSAGDRIHAGPGTLLANAAFQGGPLLGTQVPVGSTLDGAFAVTISSGGTNTITGAAGAGNPLASLAMTGEANRVADVTTTGAQTYTADSTRLAGDLTSSNAPITFNGQALLATDLTIDAGSGNILFNNAAAAAIDSESPGNFDLTLITTGQATIDGHAGSVRALGSLTTVGNSVTRIGGDVTATEGLFFGNNLRLIASSILDAGNGPARFLGTINSEGAPRDLSILSAAPTINGLASAETLRGYQVPIAFAGSIGDTLALNSLGLNYNVARAADGRASVPSVATIVFANSLNADGTITAASINPATNFVINVVNGFTMGQNEKLTAFGNLSITAALARLSDLSTIGNMAVTAPTIQLRVRPAGQVAGFSSLDLPTVANDQGLDFVAGGTIAFSTAPTAVNGPAFSAGGLPRPSFSNPDGTGDVNGTLLAFPFRAFGTDPLLPQFTDRPAPNNIQAIAFDLRSDGPTRQNVSESIAAFVVVDMPRVPEESSVGLAQRKQLEEIAIFVRDLGPDELIEALIGRALYNDKPQTVRVEDASQRRVSAGRLSFDGVKAILAEYTAILQVQGDLTSALADAVTAWFAEHPDSDFDARSFAAFLLARDESDPARQSALRVARLFVMVEELGLARYELRDCKRAIVGQILPPDLSAAQLVQTIDAINVTLRPERYPAAGGDVVTPPAPTSSPRPSDVKPSPEPDATPENPAGPANLPAPPLARR